MSATHPAVVLIVQQSRDDGLRHKPIDLLREVRRLLKATNSHGLHDGYRGVSR